MEAFVRPKAKGPERPGDVLTGGRRPAGVCGGLTAEVRPKGHPGPSQVQSGSWGGPGPISHH